MFLINGFKRNQRHRVLIVSKSLQKHMMKTLGKRHYFAFIMKMIYRHKNVVLKNYTFDSYFSYFQN